MYTVHFVTSDDRVSKKINNREIQAHSALKIIMLFKLKTIVSLQNEGYTNKWQRSPLENGNQSLSKGEHLNT